MKSQTQAYLYALSAVILWSTVATAFKMALNEINFIQLLTISTGVSTLVLTLILVASKRYLLLKTIRFADFGVLMFKGIVNPFIYYLILFKAYSLLPANEAMILNYIWPIVLVVLSIVILKQKFHLADGVSTLISFVGVVVIATQGRMYDINFANLPGVLLALGSSIVWASYWILNMKSKTDILIQLWVSFGVGFVAALTLFFAQHQSIPVASKGLYASIYVGLFEMSIPFILWQLALNKAKKTVSVSQLIFLSPFLSLMIIAIILKETILISSFLGLMMILVGIVVHRIFGKEEG